MMSLANALMICLIMTAFSCSKDDNPDNPDNAVPDPAGTITANIAVYSTIKIYDNGTYRGNISWDTPDNFYLNGEYIDVSICNLGKMKGLGNITQIPQAGFSSPARANYFIACESGHGYVIKFGSGTYVRLYVVESLVSTAGGIMGAKVKYQYPFVP